VLKSDEGMDSDDALSLLTIADSLIGRVSLLLTLSASGNIAPDDVCGCGEEVLMGRPG
jgi:hypothetical protein